ncbi:MAG: prolyl oligopeptidase family serine peptidase [Terriglobales bacterium]
MVALSIGLALLSGCSGSRSAGTAPAAAFTPPPLSSGPALHPTDLYRLRSVGPVEISPDASRVAYTISYSDRKGRPYSRVWIMNLATRQQVELNHGEPARDPVWSPNGQTLAFEGGTGKQVGLWIAPADGGTATYLAPVKGTNDPLPSASLSPVWSPDGTQIAYISTTPGPETANANGDPMVITRYLYKPTASEGLTRFNDNRRTHIFVVNVATKAVQQLTRGSGYEHSLGWSPDGKTLLYETNPNLNPDQHFTYNVFALDLASDAARRLTHTKGPEYHPVWSPNGQWIAYTATVRPLTSMETTGEDTHVWLMRPDGSDQHEIGGAIDYRQGPPVWSGDSSAVYFTIQTHGDVNLVRLPVTGGAGNTVVSGGRVGGYGGGYSVSQNNTLAFSFSNDQHMADLFVTGGRFGARAVRLTNLNQDVFAHKQIAPTVAVNFKSFDGTPVEAFLTEPLDLPNDPAPHSHPLIVDMHGGPHGQQGPALSADPQIYAGHGYAVLMVNYRGSTGYGQKFEDKIFRDQDGGEAKDVLWGVTAALHDYPWLDPNRMGLEGGSYGGQLTDWIITQTNEFKAAIPIAGISNLISFNYLSYYHDYLAVEYGGYPSQDHINDMLWDRSAIRYVNQVHTPVMFIHGYNDNDVPTEEAQQYFIALKDVGDPTVMVLYPREGHGLRETGHRVDEMTRAMKWYDRWFQPQAAAATAAAKALAAAASSYPPHAAPITSLTK